MPSGASIDAGRPDSSVEPIDAAALADGAVAADTGRPTADAGLLRFSFAGAHPQAALQPAGGRILKTLVAWNEKIYAGFGDWTANTGPIAINPYDPSTRSFAASPLLSVPTEAIDRFRVLDGTLYAPMTDPIAGESSGGYARGTVSGGVETWRSFAPVAATHVLDMCASGTDLFMVGSQSNSAVVWRSTAGGAWSEALRLTPTTGFGRFYYCFVLGDRLYVQPDFMPPSRVFDGTSWAEGPTLSIGVFARPVAFAGRIVWANAVVQTFDGLTTSSLPLAAVRDIAVDADRLFVLMNDGGLKSTTDLEAWTDVAGPESMSAMPAGEIADSLAVLDGVAYVGTSDANIWEMALP